MAAIQESVYLGAYVTGAQYEENPVPDPEPYPRPPKWFDQNQREDKDVVSQEEFDKLFE